MDEFVSIITQNGIGVTCVLFMIRLINTTLSNNNKVLDEIQKTLAEINVSLISLSNRVDKLEENK